MMFPAALFQVFIYLFVFLFFKHHNKYRTYRGMIIPLHNTNSKLTTIPLNLSGAGVQTPVKMQKGYILFAVFVEISTKKGEGF